MLEERIAGTRALLDEQRAICLRIEGGLRALEDVRAALQPDGLRVVDTPEGPALDLSELVAPA